MVDVIGVLILVGAIFFWYFLQKRYNKESINIKSKVKDDVIGLNDLNELHSDLRELKTFINGWDNHLFVMQQDIGELKEKMIKKNNRATNCFDVGTGLEMKRILSRIEDHIVNPVPSDIRSGSEEQFSERYMSMRELFNRKIDSDVLSTRVLNCLKSKDIETIGDLVSYKKNDLFNIRSFGKESVREVEDYVDNMGLSFGMDIGLYKK